MNGIPFRRESCECPSLTGGIMGLHSREIEEAMSAHFTLKRTTFRNEPAWCLQQRSGPELLPFAVHHRKVRHAITYAQEVSGMVRCVVHLEGRHRVVREVKGMGEAAPSCRVERS
jgi:hypothetical protein